MSMLPLELKQLILFMLVSFLFNLQYSANASTQNAWPVNFALSLDSFDEHIGGALHLMNVCLESPYDEPAAFYFSSSISCRQGSPDATCTEDYPPSTSTAANTGYAQSKWVVEKLCQRAADTTGLTVGVLRIGQIVGDSVKYVLALWLRVIY